MFTLISSIQVCFEIDMIMTCNVQYVQIHVKLFTLPSARSVNRRRTLKRGDRPSGRTVPPQLLGNRRRRALVSLAATNGVPDSSKSDTSHKDDRRVVHGVESDGQGGGHGEERDGEADPSWEEMKC
jgi:hypothetical protein